MSIRFRTFLDVVNSDSDAYVSYDIGDDWAHIKIADCHRSITLGFDPSIKRKAKYLKFKKIMFKFFQRMDKFMGIKDEG